MHPNSPLGRLRFGIPVLVVLALVLTAIVAFLLWTPVALPVVDAEDLAADPWSHLGSEVLVTGKWEMSAPSQRGHMVVVLRGRGGGRVACHFEDVSAADRLALENRLVRAGELVIHGRCDGTEDGLAVLRGCSLLD